MMTYNWRPFLGLVLLLPLLVSACGSEESPDYSSLTIQEARLLAQDGDALAQYSLGRRYEYRDGVSQDLDEAAKWYRLAAEQGLATAQYGLGLMYATKAYRLKGFHEDYDEAMKWFRLAAEQGYDTAQYRLGKMFEKGLGIPQDHAEAAKWFRLAAEQGEDQAQSILGEKYEEGKGVSQDYVQAHMWFNLASKNGDSAAAKRRDACADKMTPEQIAEAQKLAGEWVASH